MSGVDLTAIEGIGEGTALVILSEVGTDAGRWRNEKAFGAWLGLAPCPKKIGGQAEVVAYQGGGQPGGAGACVWRPGRCKGATARWGRSSGGSRRGARGAQGDNGSGVQAGAGSCTGCSSTGSGTWHEGNRSMRNNTGSGRLRNLAKKAGEMGYELKEKQQQQA